MSSKNVETAPDCLNAEEDQMDELVAQFSSLTTIANLATKSPQDNPSVPQQTRTNNSIFMRPAVDSPITKSFVPENNQTCNDQKEADCQPPTVSQGDPLEFLSVNGHAEDKLLQVMPISDNEQSISSNFDDAQFSSEFGFNQLTAEFDDYISVASTSSAEPSAKQNKVKKPVITRTQFRELFIKYIDKIKKESLTVFKDLSTLEKATVTHTFKIDHIDLNFKVYALHDGGFVVKVYAGYVIEKQSPLMGFSSCVFLDTPSVLTASVAMTDAVSLMPDFIAGGLSDPVSEYSKEFLTRHSIYPNDQLVKRFERSSLFCRLCEHHVLSPNMVIDHIRSNDHQLLKERFYNRYQLCLHWRHNPALTSANFTLYTVNLGRNLQMQVSTFYDRCRRVHLNRAFENLESAVDGYSIRFHLFGSYQTGLMTTLNPLIDCFVEIKCIDGTEPTYSEKLEVFRQLPFQVQGRFEAAFVGILARWETHQFNENFFFTFDPKALNAVLSSQLLAMYTYLCPPVMHLASVFRAWANQLGILKKSNEFRVSGAIFDYMSIFFMVQYYGMPIINEKSVGSSLENFLTKPVKDQLRIVKPLFDTFFQTVTIPPLPSLFMHLILFYGCGFNYQHCIQITSSQPVNKENLGFRTVKIVDVFNPGTNIFSVIRVEHAYHLDNSIFFASCEFLASPNNYTFRNLAVEFISGYNARDPGYQYLVFSTDIAKISNLGLTFNGGLASWKIDAIPRVDLKCMFCRKTNHTERYCFTLQLESVDGLPILVGMDDIFTNLINSYYTKERITEAHVEEAMKFIGRLESIILTRKGIAVNLQPFGSLKSGFGTQKSDYDLCVKFVDQENTAGLEMKDSVELLRLIGEALLAEGGFDIKPVFGAKVPILRFVYSNESQKFKGDVCYANRLALYNTKMLATYCELDERVAPLGIAIKKWASVFGINDSANHTFSSYALIIMLIHFLQRIQPPVLPYLQDIEEFKLEREVLDGEYEIQFAKPDDAYMKKNFRNRTSIGKLFIDFFDYFGAFNWQEQVVQIRSPSTLYKLDKEWQRSQIAIEDPFDLNHNLTGGIRIQQALCIYKCVNVMQKEFRKEGSLFFEEDFNFDSPRGIRLLKTRIQRSGPVCYTCGEEGHHKNTCPKGRKQRKAKPEPVKNEAPHKHFFFK